MSVLIRGFGQTGDLCKQTGVFCSIYPLFAPFQTTQRLNKNINLHLYGEKCQKQRGHEHFGVTGNKNGCSEAFFTVRGARNRASRHIFEPVWTNRGAPRYFLLGTRAVTEPTHPFLRPDGQTGVFGGTFYHSHAGKDPEEQTFAVVGSLPNIIGHSTSTVKFTVLISKRWGQIEGQQETKHARHLLWTTRSHWDTDGTLSTVHPSHSKQRSLNM